MLALLNVRFSVRLFIVSRKNHNITKYHCNSTAPLWCLTRVFHGLCPLLLLLLFQGLFEYLEEAQEQPLEHACGSFDRLSFSIHMYFHTGIKPFHCKIPGCGRQFSNSGKLRRHQEVHQNEACHSDADSESEL